MEEKEKTDEPTILFKREKRPPRVHISKEEFLHNLRNIGEWRKKYFAELHAELCAELRAAELRAARASRNILSDQQ